MRDVYSSAINAPAGRLAEVLLKRLPNLRGNSVMPDDIQARLERLIDAPGIPGKLARIRISADVSFLFERFPNWTKEKVIPIFDWASPDAQDAWEARKSLRQLRGRGSTNRQEDRSAKLRFSFQFLPQRRGA